ncbi:MAG: M23 family metallopeptidase [Saprospiraceae bacterium]|nr:M23 family metallopeptidase [Saprospiraceae bacterium]
MKKGFWVLIWLCFSFKIDYPPFISYPPVFTLVAPVRDELSITGSFGELRNNHFHGGIDIRSARGIHGDDIQSAGDGYISKIIIDSDEYGKSMYISHPNGLVTFYAHLRDFRKDISDYIKAKQYEQERFQISLDFDPDDFPVKGGEHLAYMGNTGASRGKHLHFEVRNAKDDEVWDPTHFGLPIKDDIAPTIRRIKVYGYDGNGNDISSKVYSKTQIDQASVPLEISGDVFSVGLDALDRSDNSWNYTGIKSIQLFIDGGMFYHFSADNWKRNDTKYINAHIDFGAKSASKGQFHRCFLLSGNKMNVYLSVQNDGFFYMSDTLAHEVKVIAGDANGNQSEVNFKIQRKDYQFSKISSKYQDILYHDRDKIFATQNAILKFQTGSVYEDLNCELRKHSNTNKNCFSDWIGIIPSNEPVHLSSEIRLKPEKVIPDAYRDKCFVAIQRGNGYLSVGGTWEGEELVSYARSLGPFCIALDTVAPFIKASLNRKKAFPKNQLVFKISDNVNTSREIPDIYYEARIDGQWVLMEYDKKSASIRHHFEDWLGKGKHQYEILVRDYLGNQRTYKGNFVRS